jgi:2-succinyl-5-enolpyruvyl-6-hydroxy-3-cyclohexene-1-carboxylate synthase
VTVASDADARAAKKQRQFHSARDFETSSSQIGEVEPFADHVRRKAQLIICGHSENVEEAEEMMRMLGVHPDQPSLADPLSGPIPSVHMRSNR